MEETLLGPSRVEPLSGPRWPHSRWITNQKHFHLRSLVKLIESTRQGQTEKHLSRHHQRGDRYSLPWPCSVSSSPTQLDWLNSKNHPFQTSRLYLAGTIDPHSCLIHVQHTHQYLIYNSTSDNKEKTAIWQQLSLISYKVINQPHRLLFFLR